MTESQLFITWMHTTCIYHQDQKKGKENIRKQLNSNEFIYNTKDQNKGERKISEKPVTRMSLYI